MKSAVSVVLLIIACAIDSSRCYKILLVWPFPGTSHYMLGNALGKGLAEAGHDVTMISPFEDKNPPSRGSYRDIVLTGFTEELKNTLNGTAAFSLSLTNSPITPIIMQGFVGPLVDKVFSHPNMLKLLKSGESFDAVILEDFIDDALRVLANHFNAHPIVFSSIYASAWVNGMTGNPQPLSYITDLTTSFGSEMNFLERTMNTLIYSIRQLLVKFYTFPAQDAIRKKHFPNGPSLYEIYTNVSVLLLNSHESFHQPIPLVPNMVNIGGFHIQKPKKLPDDLQKILDEAKNGVVYVSMGSNLRSKDMPVEKRDIIMQSLGRLEEKVLWKWEDENMPNKPPNVETRKWFPQSDILAHPNVKLFVTHGGMLSSTETIYHGKPILAIPVYGDQITNSMMAEKSGYARYINFHDSDWSGTRFHSLLRELLDNPSYRKNAAERSRLFHDRPIKPMDTAIWWVEYVIRNNGAHHLRVLGADIPWYKYFLLDVILFLVVISLAVVLVTVKFIQYMVKYFAQKRKIKVKKT